MKVNGNLFFSLFVGGYGKYVDMKKTDGNTALHLAADDGSVAILRTLLAAEPQVNDRNNREETALCNAARRGYLECVKLLMNRCDVAVLHNTHVI